MTKILSDNKYSVFFLCETFKYFAALRAYKLFSKKEQNVSSEICRKSFAGKTYQTIFFSLTKASFWYLYC